MLGVDLTLDDGTDYPSDIFAQSLAFAVRTVEHELDIVLDQFTVEQEAHDLYQPDRAGWWPVKLDVRPLREVTGFRAQFGSFPVVDFPPSWLRIVSPLFSSMHVIPSAESLGSYSSAFAGGVQLFVGLEGADYIPGYFEFDYEAGFVTWQDTLTFQPGQTEATFTFPVAMTDRPTVTLAVTQANGASGARLKRQSLKAITVSLDVAPVGSPAVVTFTASSVPADIRQLVLILASMLPLAVAGDLIAGAGIASISTSMDGLSQSINTTSSATNSGYGARILELRKQADALLAALRSRYKMPGLALI